MADVKVSGLPSDSSLDGNHYTILNDPTGPTTKRTLLSTLAAFFFNQTNIPDGSGSPRTRMTEQLFDFVASGLVWSGDAYASTRLASMTSGVVYINGRRLTINAVVSRTFTASRDTYVDILDNGDGTATIVYTEVTNNAASPALAANSMRVAIIITGAANIANVGSINMGEESKILPIVSSVPYAVTESLGNLICCRDPNHKLIGYRQILTGFSTTNTADTQVTGLSVPVKNPSLRKVKVSVYSDSFTASTGANVALSKIWEGAIGGTSLGQTNSIPGSVTASAPSAYIERTYTPTVASVTYNLSIAINISGTAAWGNVSKPSFIKVEL